MSLPEVHARDSARVVLVDGAGRVLLFRCRGIAPAVDDDLWTTPGGGIEDGEALADAGARELLEESGVVAQPAELGGVVAVSRGTLVHVRRRDCIRRRGPLLLPEDGRSTHRYVAPHRTRARVHPRP